MNEQDEKLDELRQFYDDEYYSRDSGESERALPWHYRIVARRLGSLKRKHVLDVACGTGQWLSLLADMGATPAGIDLSSRAIEGCKMRFAGDEGYDEGDFHVGSAESLPFTDSRFDVVTCMGSLEHFGNPGLALREMARVAKSDAGFLFLVPNAGFLTRRFGMYSGTRQVKVREDVRPLGEWERLFNDAGLRVVARWRDLHVLTGEWIMRSGWAKAPVRLAQALALSVWPLAWQYQVHFLCRRS